MKVEIGRKTQRTKEHTIDQALKTEGIYAWSGNENVRIVVFKKGSLYINAVGNRVEEINMDAWRDRRLFKVDETVTITFGE